SPGRVVRVVGQRIPLQQGEGGGAEPVCRNPVIREGLAGERVARDGVRVNWPAEVADALLRRRHLAAQYSAAPLRPPFLRPPEEETVLPVPEVLPALAEARQDDGPAEVPSVVVVAQRLLRLPRLVQEDIGRVQSVVPEELEERAVELVAAAFGDEVDHSALRL